MNTSSPPPAPDPGRTAAAQGAMNRSTAAAQQALNMVDQTDALGNSLTYNQSGNQQIWNEAAYDDKGRLIPGTGQMVTVPKYQATQRLGERSQRLLDTGMQTQQNIAEIGRDQSSRIGTLLGSNLDLSSPAIENRLFDIGRQRLDPMWQQREEGLRQQLANRGIAAGTQAFDAEMRNLNQGRNDAYNSLLMQGRGQAVDEILTQRNQPINEITALMSGSQVGQPNFRSTPTSGIQSPDYQGAVAQKHQADMAAWQAQQQSQNAMLGGLFGLGGALGGAWLRSDERAKEDITPVGKLDNGLTVHAYRYKDEHGGGPVHLGLLAQEVKKVEPKAVKTIGGLLAVDYERAVKAKKRAA